MMKIFVILPSWSEHEVPGIDCALLSNIAATSQVWLLSSGNVTRFRCALRVRVGDTYNKYWRGNNRKEM